jgi:hypothetical protein
MLRKDMFFTSKTDVTSIDIPTMLELSDDEYRGTFATVCSSSITTMLCVSIRQDARWPSLASRSTSSSRNWRRCVCRFLRGASSRHSGWSAQPQIWTATQKTRVVDLPCSCCLERDDRRPAHARSVALYGLWWRRLASAPRVAAGGLRSRTRRLGVGETTEVAASLGFLTAGHDT